MRLPIESSFSLRALPAGRALVLTAMATLLAAADWLPDNPYVDPDRLEFALTLGSAPPPSRSRLRDRLDAAAIARWRNRALLFLFTIVLSIAVAEPVDALDLPGCDDERRQRRLFHAALVSQRRRAAELQRIPRAAVRRGQARRHLSHRRRRRFVHVWQRRAPAGSLFGSAAGPPSGRISKC